MMILIDSRTRLLQHLAHSQNQALLTRFHIRVAQRRWLANWLHTLAQHSAELAIQRFEAHRQTFVATVAFIDTLFDFSWAFEAHSKWRATRPWNIFVWQPQKDSLVF
jgi:hypothetical protein